MRSSVGHCTQGGVQYYCKFPGECSTRIFDLCLQLPPPPLSCSDLLLSYYQRNTYNVKTGIVHMFLTTILIIRPLVVTPRSKPPVKRILSQFCASSGSQKFNQCSSPEQSQFLRFYAVKCRKWISSSKISLCITHR